MLYYDSCKNHTFTNIIDCKIFCSKQGYIVFYLYLCNVYRRDCCLNLQHPGMQSLHIHFERSGSAYFNKSKHLDCSELLKYY